MNSRNIVLQIRLRLIKKLFPTRYGCSSRSNTVTSTSNKTSDISDSFCHPWYNREAVMLYSGLSCCFQQQSMLCSFVKLSRIFCLFMLCWGLYILPYPVGLIPFFIHTEAMLTEALRSFLAVIKFQVTVTPIGFWSTGAAKWKWKEKPKFCLSTTVKDCSFPFSTL